MFALLYLVLRRLFGCPLGPVEIMLMNSLPGEPGPRSPGKKARAQLPHAVSVLSLNVKTPGPEMFRTTETLVFRFVSWEMSSPSITCLVGLPSSSKNVSVYSLLASVCIPTGKEQTPSK
jgi:hypothetical protein